MPFNQRKVIEHLSLPNSLGKSFEKPREKQVHAIKYLDPSNKLRQTEGVSSQNLMNDLIRDKLIEIVELHHIIKKDDLNYKSKRGKTYNFGTYSLLIHYLLIT